MATCRDSCIPADTRSDRPKPLCSCALAPVLRRPRATPGGSRVLEHRRDLLRTLQEVIGPGCPARRLLRAPETPETQGFGEPSTSQWSQPGSNR
jgi:hypothetical protein